MISKFFSRSLRAIFISTLVCGVALLIGCEKKADPAALERVEKAVASYQKIVNSYSASGFSAEEFRTQSNEADFLLRDAIKFIQAKGISESFLESEKLSDIAERWADYRNIFNTATEFGVKWREAYTSLPAEEACYNAFALHHLPDPTCQGKDYGWIVNPLRGEIPEPLGPYGVIELAKKLPEFSLSESYSPSESNSILPERVMKEIRDYKYGSDEPKDFLIHFKKYCEEGKYGFRLKKKENKSDGENNCAEYQWDIFANLNRVKSAAISQLGREAEQLDMKIKKIQ